MTKPRAGLDSRLFLTAGLSAASLQKAMAIPARNRSVSTMGWRYAGHVETGRPSRTDPGIGAMVI